jgi:hypothetical protein
METIMRGSIILTFAVLAIGMPSLAFADGQGAVTGAVGGAATGAIVGGPVGAAVGGAAGAVIGGTVRRPGPVVVQPVPAAPPCDTSTTVTANNSGDKSVTRSTHCQD